MISLNFVKSFNIIEYYERKIQGTGIPTNQLARTVALSTGINNQGVFWE